jgi:hypothetical protein
MVSVRARYVPMRIVVTLLSSLLASQTLVLAAGPEGLESSGPPSPRVVLRSDVLQHAIALEATRLARSKRTADFNMLPQSQAPQPRSWAKRHPVLLGALVGLAAGYATGWAIGDGRIADWSNDMNSWVFGAVGAGVGALVGRIVE